LKANHPVEGTYVSHEPEPVDLEDYRSYLMVLAEFNMDSRFRSKLDATDIVQQTLIRAHRGISELRSHDKATVSAWLKKILSSELADTCRHYRRGRRDIEQERQIANRVDSSAASLAALLSAEHTSPSMGAARNEDLLRLASALAKLPEDNREVVSLKHIQNMSVAQIAEQTDRSRASVAGLLSRGLTMLRQELRG
jgi:RNA polymerase sigma-70 factor (ECF subfamily)